MAHPPLIWSDSSIYDGVAWNITQGKGYTFPPGVIFAGREPGYSIFFLVPIYFLFGHSIGSVQILQILLSIITLILIFYLVKNNFSKQHAFLSIILLALYPAFIAYTFEVLTEIPFIFLLLSSNILILKAIQKGSLKVSFLGGLVTGLLTLTRFITIFLPFAYFIFFLIYLKNFKKSLQYFLCVFIGAAILVTPWIIRNSVVFNTFIFGRLGAGEIYWSGSYLPWQGEWKGYVAPLTELTQGLTPLEADRKLTRLAKESIREHPLEVLVIWLKKPGKIFLKSEFNSVLERDTKFSHFLNNSSVVTASRLKFFLLITNIILLLMALVGVWFGLRVNKMFTLFILVIIFYFTIFYLPLNPDSRYKLPLIPYIMVLVSVGFVSLFKMLRRRQI